VRWRLSITFWQFLALLISGMRRNLINSCSVMTLGHGTNTPSGLGGMAGNSEFCRIAHESFTIGRSESNKSRFTDTVQISSTVTVTRPAAWA